MFSIIVIIHEYGHYKVAKMTGVHVEEFGLGIPPRAKKLWKNKEGTLFSLNWIPLWGFVKIAWESEIFLEYYTKKWKLLSLKDIKKKIKDKDEIYTKKGKKIWKHEIKYIHARIKSHKKWSNFYEKNIFAKSAILLAGVAMNFLLAAVIFSLLFLIGVKPIWINSFIETSLPSKIIPTIDYALDQWVMIENEGVSLFPVADSIAEESWLQDEDMLLRVDGKVFEEISWLQEYISSRAGEKISMYIERKTACSPDDYDKTVCPIIEYLSLDITPDAQWRIGSYLAPNITVNTDFEYKYWIIDAIKYWVLETYYQSRLTLSGLKLLFVNIISPETPEEREEAIDNVAGPIWIVNLITQSLQWWVALLVILWAIISVNLGIFNLLPIPALDGGRLLLLWIRTLTDKIFGKTALSGNIENSVHVIFFLILIALSILIAYNDIVKIISR